MPNGSYLRNINTHSLRFRLLLLILVAVIPGIVASLYTGIQYRSHEIKRIHRETLSIVRFAADDHEEIVVRITPPLLRLLSSLYPEVISQDGPKTSALFSRMIKEYPQYTNIMAADAATGKVFASGVPLKKPLNLSDRSYFSRTLETSDYVVGEFALGKATGTPTLVCSYPVFAPDGSILRGSSE